MGLDDLQRIAAFAENLQSCRSLEESWDLFTKELDRFGFARSLYAFIPTTPKDGMWDGAVAIDNHDPAFMAAYEESGLADHDWSTEHCLTHTHAMRWNNHVRMGDLTPEQIRGEHLSWDFGLYEGITIPVRGCFGRGFGGFGLGAVGQNREEVSKVLNEHRDEIERICQCFHDTVVEKGCFNAFGLTDKERRVLALLAEGYNKHGIADKLHISSRTSEIHIYRIRRKLGVRTDAHAVAKALIANLIDP